MKVILTRPAREDLFRLFDWLEQRSPQAARDARDQIYSGLGDIGMFPYSGRVVGPRFRERPIRFDKPVSEFGIGSPQRKPRLFDCFMAGKMPLR